MWKALLCVAVMLATPSLVRALTLDEAIAHALRSNAELGAAANERAAAEGAAQQAEALPNPEFEVSGDNLGNERKRVEGDSGTTLGLSQRLELGGKRAARVRIARASVDAAEWELRGKRQEIVARVKQAFYDQLAWQQSLDLAADAMRIAEQVLEAVARRVQAGKASPVEEIKAQLASAAARIAGEQARTELAAARARLSALLGAASGRVEHVEGSLLPRDPVPPLPALLARAWSAPALNRARSEVEHRRAAIDAEQAKAVPDITLRGGVTRFSTYNDNAYMLGVSIPLPIFDRNRGAIEESHRRLDRALDEQRAVEDRWRAEVSEAHERTRAFEAQVRALRESILPGAQRAFDAAVKGYELGKFGILDVLDAQRTLIEARTQYLRALAEERRGAGELERLTGLPL